MTKNILLFGAVVVAGYCTFSAFGPKQDAQKSEIAQMVTSKLEELRAEKAQECDARVATEAKKRYDEAMAAAPAPAAPVAKGVVAKKPVKKSSTKGTKVDPLPQTNSIPKETQKQRTGSAQEGNVEQQKERSGAVQQGTPQTPEQQKKRGGAVKEGGGGK